MVGAPEEKKTLRRLRCKRDDNNKVEEIEHKNKMCDAVWQAQGLVADSCVHGIELLTSQERAYINKIVFGLTLKITVDNYI